MAPTRCLPLQSALNKTRCPRRQKPGPLVPPPRPMERPAGQQSGPVAPRQPTAPLGGLAYVCVDMPQGHRDFILPVLAATSSGLAVVHAWALGQVGQQGHPRAVRLPLQRARTGRMGAQGARPGPRHRATHVLFDNCYRDNAELRRPAAHPAPGRIKTKRLRLGTRNHRPTIGSFGGGPAPTSRILVRQASTRLRRAG